LSISSHPLFRINGVQELLKGKKQYGGAWTSTIFIEFQSADPPLATPLEGNFVGNRGKQTQSDVVEGSRIPGVCLMQCLRGKSRRPL